jgi:tetratricopeptide (TPR) repeat protein
MVGAFADRDFPAPSVSVYGARRHRWLTLPEGIEHDEVWSELQSLYAAGEYAAVADRGRELIAANPLNAQLIYNVACCESLAGRAGDAIEHLRRAIAIAPDPLRGMAAEDSDLDAIRGEPAFRALLGGVTPPTAR